MDVDGLNNISEFDLRSQSTAVVDNRLSIGSIPAIHYVVRKCACVPVCVCVRVCVCACVHVCTCTHTLHLWHHCQCCMYIHKYACMNVRMYVCMNIVYGHSHSMHLHPIRSARM